MRSMSLYIFSIDFCPSFWSNIDQKCIWFWINHYKCMLSWYWLMKHHYIWLPFLLSKKIQGFSFKFNLFYHLTIFKNIKSNWGNSFSVSLKRKCVDKPKFKIFPSSNFITKFFKYNTKVVLTLIFDFSPKEIFWWGFHLFLVQLIYKSQDACWNQHLSNALMSSEFISQQVLTDCRLSGTPVWRVRKTIC